MRYGIGLVLSLLIFGCQQSDPENNPNPVSEDSEFKKIEIDYFTLGYHIYSSNPEYEVTLSEEGAKYFKTNSPETEFQTDGFYAFVRPEFKPTMWDSYLCVDQFLAYTEGIPDIPPLVSFKVIGGNPPNPTRYYYISKEDLGKHCSKNAVNTYDPEKGFKVPGGLGELGTITIYYK